ncbi:MAG: hypothetical protein ACOX3T_00590 [Bdellovibrionota bacterium]
MVSPINNYISIGVSPIVSNQASNDAQVSQTNQKLSKTQDYTRDTTSVNMASQSATALGSQRKDGIQYSNRRTEKAFGEDDENQELTGKEKKKKNDKHYVQQLDIIA